MRGEDIQHALGLEPLRETHSWRGWGFCEPGVIGFRDPAPPVQETLDQDNIGSGVPYREGTLEIDLTAVGDSTVVVHAINAEI